jgi:hypothetical protein
MAIRDARRGAGGSRTEGLSRQTGQPMRGSIIEQIRRIPGGWRSLSDGAETCRLKKMGPTLPEPDVLENEDHGAVRIIGRPNVSRCGIAAAW